MKQLMRHLEEIADTLGFTLAIGKDSIQFNSSAKRTVYLIPDESPKGGLDVTIKPKIETTYHEPHNGLAILGGTLVGDLGFLVYNSQCDGIDCVDVALFDKSKLDIVADRYFEHNAHLPISVLASDFDKGLVCQVRRMAGSRNYSLIDDRRESKGKTDDHTILDGGGTEDNPVDASGGVAELPPEHSEA